MSYISTKVIQLIFKCTGCSKSYKKHFNKDLIKRFENTYEFCDRDINKFILLSTKGVYPYEYMDSLERFDEELLRDKEAFCSSLNMQDITDVNYRHAKKKYSKTRVIHYYLQLYLRILEINVLKCINLILLIFYLHQDWHGKHF